MPAEMRPAAAAALRTRLARAIEERDRAGEMMDALSSEIENLEHEVAVQEGRPCGCLPAPQLRLLPGDRPETAG